jgi:hypothetical protein
MNVNVFAESWRVIVSYGLGVTERFKDRIGLQNLLFYPRVFTTDGGQILENQFGTLCFTRSTFATITK